MTESWLKGCEVCNAGLCKRMNELIESGLSQRKAAEMLAKEVVDKHGVALYSANALKIRYGRNKYGWKDDRGKSGSDRTGSKRPTYTWEEEFDAETERLKKEFAKEDAERKKFFESLELLTKPFPTDLKPMLRLFVHAGYRELAKKFHPDVGGTHEDMTKVNNVKDILFKMSV